MASMDEVITELKRLRPEQMNEVARVIHDLSQAGCEEAPLHPTVPRPSHRPPRNRFREYDATLGNCSDSGATTPQSRYGRL
jgi:hypothetical protein